MKPSKSTNWIEKVMQSQKRHNLEEYKNCLEEKTKQNLDTNFHQKWKHQISMAKQPKNVLETIDGVKYYIILNESAPCLFWCIEMN